MDAATPTPPPSPTIVKFLEPETITADFFSAPPTGIEAVLIANVQAATKQILAVAYEWTLQELAAALIAAHDKGVACAVIVNKGLLHAKNGHVQSMAAAGIPVKVDAKHKIAHQKLLIIDSEITFIGSYNFTVAAETENAECLAKIKSAAFAAAATANFELHASHSQAW